MPDLVVVAVNDTPAARAALDWAATWARTTGSRLRAVHVLAPQIDAAPAFYPGAVGWVKCLSPEATQLQKDAFGELFNELPPEAGWTMEFAEGEAGPEIIGASAGASLLVVGTRHLHGLARVLEGSVSQYVVRHADCPVLAVPAGAAHHAVPTVDPSRRGPAAGARGNTTTSSTEFDLADSNGGSRP